jgi:alpha,alpha-trehalase
MWLAIPIVLSLSTAGLVHGQSSASFSPTPVSTAVPAPTGPLNETVNGQGIYPPTQGRAMAFLYQKS